MKLLKKVNTGSKFLLKGIKHLLPLTWLKKLTPRQRLFFWAGVGALLIFAVPLIVAELFFPKGSKAAWFDENYLYRQVANISNSNSTQLTDFQVALTVNTASLISAGKMQENCNDIRITDQDGNVLPYLVESGPSACNTGSTVIWTKTNIATSGASLYFYYGNQQANNAQNGSLVFDEWDLTTFSELDPNNRYSISSPSALTVTNLSSNENAYVYKEISPRSTGTVEIALKRISGASKVECYGVGVILDDCANNSDSSWFIWRWGSAFRGLKNAATQTSDIATNADDTFYYLTIKYDGTNATYYAYSDPSRTTLLGSQTQTYSSNWKYIFASSSYDDSSGATINDTINNFHLRKYAAVEPSISMGSEEKSPSPVANWGFDEGVGNVASSSASPNFPVALYNTTWLSESQCVEGKCLNFNGSTAFGSASNVSSQLKGSAMTISGWVKPSSTQASHAFYFGIRNDANADFYILQLNGGTSLEMRFRNSGGTYYQCSGIEVTPNRWNFLTLVYDGSTLSCYIDGVLKNSLAASGSITSSTASFMLGSSYASGAYFFNGTLDEVKGYDYALSAAQVKANYNARGGLNAGSNVLGVTDYANLSNGLVGYWKMDEASWNGTSGEVVDSSGNNNNATSFSGANATPSAKFGNAGYFAGTDEYASVSYASPQDRTYAVWVKPATTLQISTRNQIFGQSQQDRIDYGNGVGTSSFHAQVVVSNPTQSLEMTGTGNGVGAWTHLVLTIDATNGIARYFVDGVLSSSVTWDPITRPLVSLPAVQYFAGCPGCTYFPGNVDDVRLYNRALDQLEVQQLYNFAPGPVGYWDFEAGKGRTVNDMSTYGNNGVWSGTGNTWGLGKYGKGGNFNGTDNYVRVNSPITTAGHVTVSFWLKIPEQPGSFRRILSDPTNGITMYFNGNNSGLYGSIGDSAGGWLLYSTTLADGKWHYITIVASSDLATVYSYLDGRYHSCCVDHAAGFTTITLDNLYMGMDSGGTHHLSGGLDEVMIYNYVRTQAQIIEDMNASHPITGGPVGSQLTYLKLDEGYGTTANDSSINKYTGTLVDGPTWTNAGRFGKALSFDGINDRIQAFPNPATFPYTGGQLSLSVWFKPSVNETSAGFIISKPWNSNGEYNYWLLYNSNRTVQLHIAGSGAVEVDSTSALRPSEWNHIVATVNGDPKVVNIYINGKLDKTSTYAMTNWTPVYGNEGLTPLIGCLYPYAPPWSGDNTHCVNGVLDEVKIYQGLLTAQDVKADYNRNSSLVLGAAGMDSTGVASNSAGAYYCVPGDTSQSCSPTGEWKFEEARGGTVNDTSGNSNTGTWSGTGAPHFVTGKVGWGGKFNGINDSVTISDVAALRPSQFSISFWVKKNSEPLDFARIVQKNAASTSGWAALFNNASPTRGVYFAAYNTVSGETNTNNKSTSLPIGEWRYYVYTFNGSQIATYENGKFLGNDTFTGTFQPSTASMFLASSELSNAYSPIVLDDVRFYDYALSSSQVGWSYNNGKPLGQWRMDECQGTVVRDSSGNGNTGTIQIGPLGTQTTVGTCQNTNSAAAWYNGRSGKWNSSLDLDGTDDFVQLSQSLSLARNSFGVSAWFKTTAIDDEKIFSTGSSYHQLGTYLGTLRICVLTCLVGTANVSDGQWHHAVVVGDDTSIRAYLDGKLAITGDPTTGSMTGFARIGAQGADGGGTAAAYLFDGQVDDVQVFNYAPTAVQVKNLYNNRSSVYFGPATGTP